MSVTFSDEKNDLIKYVARCQGFDEYEFKVRPESMKGDGYLGIINTVDIQDKNKPNKSLHLIIKSAPVEEKFREQYPIKKAYKREIYMYTTVFSEFAKISEEIGISNRFNETARCLGSSLTDKQECLALENLKHLNFKLWDRKIAMNEEHVALVFTTYAKFHATGIVFKFLKPEKFEEICKNLVNIFDKKIKTEADLAKQTKNVFANGFRAIASNTHATQALTKFSQESFQFFYKDIKKLDKFSTILHGDCWCNNMMFKYEDTDPLKPTEMCLLDWQMSYVGSPILDLSYFFYANSPKEVLYNLEKFLKIYYDTFITTIKDAGLTQDFSYDELKQQWKFYSRNGLFMALFIIKVILSDSEEAPDLGELAKRGKGVVESLTLAPTKNAEEIDKRIYDIIVFMCEHDYL